MLEQIYRIQQLSGERVSNIVVMGTGEPLDNYDNLLSIYPAASRDEHGLNISQRNITVSTCGIGRTDTRTCEMRQLQITLAISLHASNQEKRKETNADCIINMTLRRCSMLARYYFQADRTAYYL